MKKQQGQSLVSWLVILTLIGFGVTLFFKLMPVYSENANVGSILESVAGDPKITQGGGLIVQKNIASRFVVDSISYPTSNQVQFLKEGQDYYLVLNYEKRVKGFLNIDLLASFKHKVKVKIN